MDGSNRVGERVTAFVAELMRHPSLDLPAPYAPDDDWLEVLQGWLERYDCGLVAIAHPETFSWPGYWIGIVDNGEGADRPTAVLLFGTPSAVIASPDAPLLVGRAADEVRFHQALLLAPFQPFPTAADNGERRVGNVVGLYISAVKTEPMQAVAAAQALPGRGLAGDRYAAGAGTFSPSSNRLRGYALTLIEAEALEHATFADGAHLTAPEARRNIVTRGIDLNALVGKEFSIGSVRAYGHCLCEPCVHLQRLSRPGVIAELVHQGGLRADILSEGEIRVGDTISPVPVTGDGVKA
ncbi:MAG: hypothetical protein M3Z20_19965 [Chloroflexota bacterium]|nr:hypothetical protein [Chloroflexota bacterium]